MSSLGGAVQVLIIASSVVYLSLALITSFWLGGEGVRAFLSTSSAGIEALWLGLSATVPGVWAGLCSAVAAAPAHVELMRLALLNTVDFFLQPWCLVVMYMVFFTGLFTLHWAETKSNFALIYAVLAEALGAVWVVASDPKKMLQYSMFVILVRLFPEVVERLSVQTMKSAKV